VKTGQRAALVLAILAAALAVRMVGLGSESLWFDEGFSAQMAESGSLREWAKDTHPPLYYALLSAWRHVDGSDAGLRFLCVILAVLTVAVVYATALRLFGPEPALWSALILSAAQLHVVYSQEARMYTLMVLLYAGALWGLARVSHGGRARAGWCAYVACSALLCYSHGIGTLYWVVLAAVFFAVMLARAGTGPWLWKYVAANLLVAALFAPWMGVLLARTRAVAGRFWIERPGLAMPVRILLYDFAMPRLSGPLSERSALAATMLPVKWLLPLPFAACMAAAVLWHERTRRQALAIVLGAMLLPVAALFGLSVTVRPLLLPKTALPVVVPYALTLGAAACVKESWRAPARVLLSLAVAVLCLGTFLVLSHPEHTEGWRDASVCLQSGAERGDAALIFSTPGHTQHTPEYLLRRYDPAGQLDRLRWVRSVPFTTHEGLIAEGRLPELLGLLEGSPVVWVVERRGFRERIVAEQLAELLPKGAEWEFSGVHVTTFSLSASPATGGGT
jgi:uncharacterized membrane protein